MFISKNFINGNKPSSNIAQFNGKNHNHNPWFYSVPSVGMGIHPFETRLAFKLCPPLC